MGHRLILVCLAARSSYLSCTCIEICVLTLCRRLYQFSAVPPAKLFPHRRLPARSVPHNFGICCLLLLLVLACWPAELVIYFSRSQGETHKQLCIPLPECRWSMADFEGGLTRAGLFVTGLGRVPTLHALRLVTTCVCAARSRLVLGSWKAPTSVFPA